MKKIGILGGTFDPIHKGHIAIAEGVRKKLRLDFVLLIPCNRSPHKRNIRTAPAHHRLAMVRLAVRDHPRLKASAVEVQRSGISYTIDTLKILRRRYPRSAEFFLILGVDAFAGFQSWRTPREILRRANLVVVFRPGSPFSALGRSSFLKRVLKLPPVRIDRRRGGRFEVGLESGTRLIFLRIAARDVSATQIRSRRADKRGLKNLLPANVESYIIKKSLYI